MTAKQVPAFLTSLARLCVPNVTERQKDVLKVSDRTVKKELSKEAK